MKKLANLLIIMLVTLNYNLAQNRIFINGFVTDARSKEPIPYTNIHFKQSLTGTTTQNDGRFAINTAHFPDTLIVSSVGYVTTRIVISEFRNYTLGIELEPVAIELTEVVIVPGENPANIIMRKVIGAKQRNNPMNANTMACNTYTKVLVRSKDKNTLPSADKSTPFYFSEKYSQNIIQQHPFYEKGKILTERQEGLGILGDMSVMGYSNNLSLGFNFYDNIIEVFDKPFISPLSNRGSLFYRYYLKDSLMSMFGKEYLLEFTPRNDRDMAFTGYMKIIDDVWAMSEIYLALPLNANLNYVNSLKIFQSFQMVNDSLTFFHINETEAEIKITKDNQLIDLNFTALINKRTVYDHVKMNFPAIQPGKEEEIWGAISPKVKAVKGEILMDVIRPEALTLKEQSAIVTIDSLNNNWLVKTTDAVAQMFITGYLPGKYFDLGPYLELIKKNRVEGFRYTLSGRTSTAFTKNTMLYGHLGYGTRDMEWKYSAGVMHKFEAQYRRLATLEYRNDLSRIGDNRSIFLIKENMLISGEDNLIASLFTSSLLDKISRQISYRAEYEHEWKQGVTTFTSFSNKTIYSGIYLPFFSNNQPVTYFSTNEIMLGLRLSWRENYTDNYNRRYYMTTQYPIVNFRVTGGSYQLGAITDQYFTARAVINHDVNIGQTKLDYLLETGITLGAVPFPLLDINRTDHTMGYSLYSFNMMNEMEFASDRFVSLMTQYRLNGLFFNRVPLLKRMGIREVFSAKVLWSHLGDHHKQLLNYPVAFYDARIPYAEVSAGIENLFQYLRFDVVCRLTHLQNQGVNTLGIRARFDVNF